MLMEHILKHGLATYKDGFQSIEYCPKCGAEGMDLFTTSCKPQQLRCTECGHFRYTNIPCGHCKELRTNLKNAIDKYNDRN